VAAGSHVACAVHRGVGGGGRGVPPFSACLCPILEIRTVCERMTATVCLCLRLGLGGSRCWC
jgi:hypothetical protein